MKDSVWRMLFGIALVVFGLIALVLPGWTAATLVIVVGAFLIAAGIFLILGGAMGKEMKGGKWVIVLEGILSLIIGILFIVLPGMSLVALLYLFAAWMLIWGVLELVAGFVVPVNIPLMMGKHSKVLLILMGILSIVVAFLLFVYPGDGIIALVWVVAIYAIIIGVTSIVGAAAGTRA
jgi:uncharacterized membrane protein HdeD (DUF308 family)